MTASRAAALDGPWDPAHPSTLEVQTLVDGGQRAATVGEWVAAFIGEARHSLAIALYDLALSEATAAPVIQAINEAAGRGVEVRVASRRVASPESRTSCTTSTWCGTARRCGRAP